MAPVEQLDAGSIMASYSQGSRNHNNSSAPGTHAKKTGTIRIGVLEPTSSEHLETSNLQQFLAAKLMNNNVDAIAVASLTEAKELKCDLVLQSQLSRVKQSSKVGGLLKAVRNIDPYSESSYNIDARFVLLNVIDGSAKSEKITSGKFEGTADGALKKALIEGSLMIIDEYE
jgi:hypothetical protein